MQAYGRSFARVYNMRWTGFAQQMAPRLRAYYESTALGHEAHTMLDLCCGTGQLTLHFLDNGYQVTGLDLSDAMLDHARANAAPYIITGQARFRQADAASFTVEEPVGLVVSTFDALYHLASMEALRGCFRSVYAALLEGGTFLFDLNTREGLRRWAGIQIEDTPDIMIITRGLYDEESGRWYTRISGFTPAENGLYERFEETAYNTAFDMKEVEAALLEAGFKNARFAKGADLSATVEEPEQEGRIFITAEK